ncbi:MAG: iron ABC transporter permease [Pseudomonadota bacterium]
MTKQRIFMFLCLIVLTIIAIWLGVSIGALKADLTLPANLVWHAISGEERTQLENIAQNIRLPRVLMAFMVGASLAISGASLQGICRNPLADPGLLGISSGAAVAAVAVILFSSQYAYFEVMGSYAVSAAAVGGAATTAFIVYRLAQVDGKLQVPTLLLAGVALNSLGVAIIGLFNYLADEQSLRLITFWLLGSLGGANWLSVSILFPALSVGLVLTYWHRHNINLLLLGEANAEFSGVNVDRVKQQLLWLNALTVGVAVAFSGIIAFVGLVVPHILRVMSDTNYRFLLLNSALLGGALMVIADMFSRIMVAPAELPVGILTALIGAPFFILILNLQKRKFGFSL